MIKLGLKWCVGIRLGSSHELARTSSDRACFFPACLGSLVNFGSLWLVKIWLGPDRSKNLTARQLASQLRARKFYEIAIEQTIEQARNDFFLMSLKFLNFIHFQIVKNDYILPTFANILSQSSFLLAYFLARTSSVQFFIGSFWLGPDFLKLNFGSDRLGPDFLSRHYGSDRTGPEKNRLDPSLL